MVNLTINNPLKKATLCFFIKKDYVLLALKKRGFGKGKWNGIGGKLNEGETIENAAIRETIEEIDVTPLSIKKIAILNFYFPDSPEKNRGQQVNVFLVDKWEGIPKETEEMKPRWYKFTEIPFNMMWQDDKYWLPIVLQNKFISGDFYFDKKMQLTSYKIKNEARSN